MSINGIIAQIEIRLTISASHGIGGVTGEFGKAYACVKSSIEFVYLK